MENSPKTLSKVYLALQLSRVCSLIAHSSNSAAKKSYCLQNIYYCLCNWNFPWWKGENSSFDITLMREHIPVWLQLEKFLPFPKANKRFYRCRSIPCIFYGKVQYHKKCMNVQVEVFWDENYHMQWKWSVCRK